MKKIVLSLLFATLLFQGCSPDDSKKIPDVIQGNAFIAVVNGSSIVADVDFINGVIDGDNRFLVDVGATFWQDLYNSEWFSVDWVIPAQDNNGNLFDYRVSGAYQSNTTSGFYLCELTTETPNPKKHFDIPEYDANGKRTDVSIVNLSSLTTPIYNIDFIQGDVTTTVEIPEIPACVKYKTTAFNDLDFSTVTEIIINGLNYDMDSLPLFVTDNYSKLSNMDFSIVQLPNGQHSFIPLIDLNILK